MLLSRFLASFALLIVMHERQIDKYFFFTRNFNPRTSHDVRRNHISLKESQRKISIHAHDNLISQCCILSLLSNALHSNLERLISETVYYRAQPYRRLHSNLKRLIQFIISVKVTQTTIYIPM